MYWRKPKLLLHIIYYKEFKYEREIGNSSEVTPFNVIFIVNQKTVNLLSRVREMWIQYPLPISIPL